MKLETFFDNFEMLAEAPNGVKKLREMILELAVRGKLVAQDERDEPASVLLERIKAKKEVLIKEKKNKKENSFESITEVDIPFGLPKGWIWCRVGDIALIKGGKRLPNGTMLTKVPTNHIYIRVSDMKNGTIDDNDLHYVTNDVYENIKNYIIEKDDLYLTIVGSTIGKVGIVPEKFHRMNLTENAARIIIYEVDRLFINYAMNSKFIQKQFFDKTKQLGQPKLALNRIVSTYFPLPPLAEQHRIVAKVDQLMSLCDELEARQQKKRETRARINSAALDRLLAARAPGEFAEGWRRISDNFDLLYDAPENVGALRQAILQLAVMGKLVAQDEKDESAEVLVERINDENKIQIENHKNKKTPLFSPIKLNPFELPENWKWCRMGEIAKIMMGNSPPGDSYNENGIGIPLINGPVEFSKGPFGYTNKTKFTTKPTKLCEENDLLICVRGSTTGRTNIAGFQACIGRGVAAIRARIYQQYVNYFVLSIRQQIYDLGTGSTFPSVSYGQLMELPIPLPPLAEQLRIVARVDQLMSLCDELEAGLMRSQVDSEKLMEAVVGKMLAGGDSA